MKNHSKQLRHSFALTLALAGMMSAVALLIYSWSVPGTVAAQGACIQPPPGLISWWPGDGHGVDIVGSNDGTFFNGAYFAPGKVGQAFSFDGVNDRVEFGTSTGNFGTSDFTIDWWMKTTFSSAGQSAISKRDGCQANSFYDVRIGGSGKVVFEINQGSINSTLLSVSAVNDGQWHHIAVIRRGVTSEIYVDGLLEATTTVSSVINPNNSAHFIAGRSPCTGVDGTVHYKGELDEIELFNRAHSASEIADIYNAGSAGKCKPSGVPVDPRATYLHTSDNPAPPSVVDLAGAGFAPGDFLKLTYEVPSPGFSFNCNQTPRVGANDVGILGVFSGSSTLLAPSERFRLPNAIDAGPDVTTGPTFFGNEPTDITQDFHISPPSGFTIEVPAGATHLFLGVSDSFYQDNCGEIKVFIERADGTPPTTTASLSPTPNGAGWNNSDATVTLTATDNADGSGVKEITYSASGAQVLPSTTVSGASTSFAITAEGITTITFAAKDNAGNTEASQTIKVKLDKTAPASSCDAADGLWHASDVTISCIASDSGSGLANTADASFSLSTSVASGTETANASTNSRTLCDVAGNCTTAGPVSGNKVDKKAPGITITEPTSTTYTLNQSVAASYACSDGGSGLASCAGPVTSGSNLNTASVGSFTFTVNATDHVGNSASQSVSYTVSYKICLLYDPAKVHKSGSTVPIKIQLCDANGVNVSSSEIVVTALSVTKVSSNVSGPPEDAGNANPDDNFRYDPALGGAGGYIYNLSTKGYETGTYDLNYKAGSDPTVHKARFQVG